jgi:predicted dehydrogenase
MAEQVKVGVIGTSWWADLAFLPTLQTYERAHLAAICGRNRERADEMAAKFGIPQVFTDYRRMIDQGKLDAVIVSTPDDTHYEMVMAALDAGLHVLCEKPVALNANHARQMYEKAQAAKVKHMVMYTWHWLPPIQRLKQLLDDGYLGQIYHGNFHWLSSFGRSPSYAWRMDADRANGVLGDLGSHMIHLAQWLIGDVAAVSAHLGFHINREGADGKPLRPANDAASVTLEHSNGTHTQIQLSVVAHRLNSRISPGFSLYGAKGTLGFAWDPKEDGITMHLHGAQEVSEEQLDEKTQLGIELFDSPSLGPRLFVASILENRTITPGLWEGHKVQQVIDAALQSDQSGCRVTIA